MSNLQHKLLPFSELHKAKLPGGLEAALPLASEGLGDTYYATDTGTLFIGLADFSWAGLSTGGGLAYEGARAYMSSNLTLPGDDSSSYVNWSAFTWEQGADFGTFPGSGFNQPELGFYEFHLNLILDNSAPARWHLEAWYDGGDTQVSNVDFYTDGGGNSVILSLSDQFRALKDTGGGGYFYVYLYQNSGVDLDVKTWSSITFRRIGDEP